ncbi:hypothetical protein B0H16DRAFT_1461517 [Mycena metata]|uniref:Uncharacterized protein n=1 Tax=Mycena metata TaxID=1033252 RepID=A0AAD7IT88_9AGAR|nr:hypothetical protein B0H16DRAFT_1461517 [Mycena metata]
MILPTSPGPPGATGVKGLNPTEMRRSSGILSPEGCVVQYVQPKGKQRKTHSGGPHLPPIAIFFFLGILVGVLSGLEFVEFVGVDRVGTKAEVYAGKDSKAEWSASA